MSVYSMTGYATAVAALPGPDGSAHAVTVDIRSVNGRFLDLSFRLPEELRGLEPALRDLLGTALRRGKVELRLNVTGADANALPQPTTEQLHRLSQLEAAVQGWLPQARGLSVHETLNWCRSAAPPPKLDEAALDAARRAVAGLREARQREGERLTQALMERVQRLRALADQAEPLVPAVVQRQQQRFLERWQEALAAAGAAAVSVGAAAAQDRALSEAAAFAIRVDVAEELQRLRSHLEEIARLLAAGGELGKRLDFLIQELQREANTLGSKSAALELTNISVEMKVLIEQLREQVQNIE